MKAKSQRDFLFLLITFLFSLIFFNLICVKKTSTLTKIYLSKGTTPVTTKHISKWIKVCMDTIKTRRKDMPLAPFTFQGRVQVDINDQFHARLYGDVTASHADADAGSVHSGAEPAMDVYE